MNTNIYLNSMLQLCIKKKSTSLSRLSWFKNLGTFILNMEKKFVTFPHKEKMITLQDTTSEPDSVTLEDFNDISKVILQENKKKNNAKDAKRI
jgi:hypothetical protein